MPPKRSAPWWARVGRTTCSRSRVRRDDQPGAVALGPAPTEVVAVGSDSMPSGSMTRAGHESPAPLRGHRRAAGPRVLLLRPPGDHRAETSIVVRTTRRAAGVCELLLPIRRAAEPGTTPLPGGLGPDRRPQVDGAAAVEGRLPRGMDRLLVGRGTWGNPEAAAAQRGRPLCPVPSSWSPPTRRRTLGVAQYGVDMLAVARRRVRAIGGSNGDAGDVHRRDDGRTHGDPHGRPPVARGGGDRPARPARGRSCRWLTAASPARTSLRSPPRGLRLRAAGPRRGRRSRPSTPGRPRAARASRDSCSCCSGLSAFAW